MAGTKGTKQDQRREAAGRTFVTLPSQVAGSEAAWPGSAKGGSRNSELRTQLIADITPMTLGSVRRYDITGAREQTAFVNLFRKMVDEVHNDSFGVQAVKQDACVFVKLGNRRANKK